jgi:hypothetical protein
MSVRDQSRRLRRTMALVLVYSFTFPCTPSQVSDGGNIYLYSQYFFGIFIIITCFYCEVACFAPLTGQGDPPVVPQPRDRFSFRPSHLFDEITYRISSIFKVAWQIRRWEDCPLRLRMVTVALGRLGGFLQFRKHRGVGLANAGF